MQSIKIKELHLENFRCHGNLTLSPNGQNMSIYGDNAAGKTTIYDAFTWLLFGTDSVGNSEKSIEIKPLNANGEVADHQAITSVEAVLLVNGEEVSLRRTLQEVWTTKRGNPEPVFSGNSSEYYVDGIPVKANAFKDTIGDIISADLFKLLTNVHYFAQDLHWQKRREKLFEMAGTMSDDDIMATDVRFDPLKQAMGKLTLDNYKAKLTAEKKAMTGTRNEVPARINECAKTIEDLEGLDFQAARDAVEILNGRLEVLQGDLAKIENNTAVTGKQMELREAQLEAEKLDAENKAFRNSQAPNDPNTRVRLCNQLAMASKGADAYAARQKDYTNSIARMDAEIQSCKDQWKAVNSETFSAKACPTCGQNLPADQIRAAQERFEVDKKRRLQEIVKNADNYKNHKKNVEADLANAQAEEARLRAEVKDLEDQMTKMDIASVMAEDLEGYEERRTGIQNWIDQIQNELHKLSQDAYSAANTIRQEISDVKRQIADHMAVIGKESALAYARERIQQLRADAANAAEKLAEAERFLFLIEEYGRYKAKFVEDSVNGLFRITQFRLFRAQANGGIEARADATHNGVPYMDLNSGCKINVGIDIINALSRAYGIAVPLVVDNAESVTQLEVTNTQVIRLVVSEADKALRVVYHN